MRFIILLLCISAITFAGNFPERIISLGPVITEELFLLGVGDRVIGNTIYCINPPEAKTKEKIGTVIEINIEKILSLKPDLVLATNLTDQKAVKKLKTLGIRVESFSYPENFNRICLDFLKLGKLVGKEKKAKEIIKKSKIDIKNIIKKTKFLVKQKVLVQLGAKPLYVAPKELVISELIEFAGGINIGPSGRSGIYSREQAVKDNPDVIIILNMGIATEEEKKRWLKYKTINAVKNNRIYIIDSYKLGSLTPVSFVNSLKEIVEILHEKKTY